MWKSRFSYLVLCACLFVYSILYVRKITLVFAVSIFVFPFLSGLIALYIAKRIEVRLMIPERVCYNGETAQVFLKVDNHAVFPIAKVEIQMEYENSVYGETGTKTTVLSLNARTSQTIRVSITPAFAGNIKFTVTKLRVVDYTSCFCKKSMLNSSIRLLVMPKVEPIKAPLVMESRKMFENEMATVLKPGDDVSEILQIREYKPGDRLSRIHWKLTSKMDQIMVKELANLLHYYPVFLVDTRRVVDNTNKQELECIYRILYALSIWHIEYSKPFELAFYNSKSAGLVHYKVTSIPELYYCMQELYENNDSRDRSLGLQCFYAKEEELHYSDVIYLTSELTDENILKQVDFFNVLVKTTVEEKEGGDCPYFLEIIESSQFDLHLDRMITDYIAWNRGEFCG